MKKKTKKYYWIGVIVISAVVLSTTFVLGQSLSFFDKVAQIAGEKLGLELSGKVTGELSEMTESIGAVTGPEINSPFVTIGGVDTWYTKVIMGSGRYTGGTYTIATGTTTPCNMRAPNATSTLIFAGADFITSSTTNMNAVFGKATTPNATTTAIGNVKTISANAKGYIAESFASSSPSYIFGPNEYLNLSVQGGLPDATYGTRFTPKGSCVAIWRRLTY